MGVITPFPIKGIAQHAETWLLARLEPCSEPYLPLKVYHLA